MRTRSESSRRRKPVNHRGGRIHVFGIWLREVANQTPDASSRKALEDLLALRDRVTAELAKGDTAAMADLQELFDKTRQATRSSREP